MDAGIDLVAISVDTLEDGQALRRRLDLEVPLLSDQDAAVIAAWGVEMKEKGIAIPATFVVDAAGKIRWAHVGETMMDRPAFDAVLDAASEP